MKGSQVPGYIKANFDKAWDKFDINADGYIKAEETHTFMRSLMGKLNKFALAPGSLSDIGASAQSVSSSPDLSSLATVPKRSAKKAAPKKEELTESADATASTDASAADPTADSTNPSDDTSAADAQALELAESEILP